MIDNGRLRCSWTEACVDLAIAIVSLRTVSIGLSVAEVCVQAKKVSFAHCMCLFAILKTME